MLIATVAVAIIGLISLLGSDDRPVASAGIEQSEVDKSDHLPTDSSPEEESKKLTALSITPESMNTLLTSRVEFELPFADGFRTSANNAMVGSRAISSKIQNLPTVSGVFLSNGVAAAMLDGKLKFVGDSNNDYELHSVSQLGVTLVVNGEKVFVGYEPGKLDDTVAESEN